MHWARKLGGNKKSDCSSAEEFRYADPRYRATNQLGGGGHGGHGSGAAGAGGCCGGGVAGVGGVYSVSCKKWVIMVSPGVSCCCQGVW